MRAEVDAAAQARQAAETALQEQDQAFAAEREQQAAANRSLEQKLADAETSSKAEVARVQAEATAREETIRAAATAAADAGVKRIVYLGGLGSGSEHLDSRNHTARTLIEGEVPVAYFRAAAVIGAGSESFRTVYYLVRRLPAMVTPKWTTVKTQPIGVKDIVTYLAAAADLHLPLDRELQVAGPDVTTYGGMIDEVAKALGHRAPLRITVPVLTPHLSSLWVGLVTPVDTGVVKPLIEGLSHETVVTDPSGMEALPDHERTPLDQALREAVASVPVR